MFKELPTAHNSHRTSGQCTRIHFYGMHTALPLFLKNVRAKGTVSSKADGEKAILCLYLF